MGSVSAIWVERWQSPAVIPYATFQMQAMDTGVTSTPGQEVDA